MRAPVAASSSRVSSAPVSPTDETKVPHYFGPYPNWANSPFTLPDATVAITGDGTGATAVASVGANGAVTGITITNPGSGYTAATVSITGAGTGATAVAVVTLTGAVVKIDGGRAGRRLHQPPVTITGGGAITDATATAYGGVDAVTLISAGSGYTHAHGRLRHAGRPERRAGQGARRLGPRRRASSRRS